MKSPGQPLCSRAGSAFPRTSRRRPGFGFLVLLLLLGTRLAAWAQDPTPVDMLYRFWNTRDGLPHDHVRDLVRTRDGFLWIATDGGLSRFDGLTFKSYGLRDGLGAIAVLSLLEADDGALWISTTGGGISVLRHGRIERTYTQTDGLESMTISSLAEDAEHHLWVASRAGIDRLEGHRFVPLPNVPFPKGPLPVLYRDRTGTMWVAMGAALWTWKDKTWTKTPPDGPQNAWAFCEDSQGRLWIVSQDQKLWCREPSGWKSYPISSSFGAAFNSISAAPDGTIWCVSYRAGVIGFRDGMPVTPLTRGESFFDLVESVHATPNGQLWLGTSTNGLYALTPLRLTPATIDDKDSSQSANFIGSLLETAPDEFLIGTQGRCLYRWRAGKTESLAEEPDFSRSLFINGSVKSRDNVIWLATGRGIYQYRGGRRTLLSTSGNLREIWDLCEDHAGGMWIGTGWGGLFYANRGRPTAVNFGSQMVSIKGMAEEADGTMWVGTRGNGLYRRKKGAWRRFGIPDGLLSEVIRVVAVDHQGTVWVGTAGGGLAALHGERFVSVTTREGLLDDTISQITEDPEGRLWLGTNRGLAVLSPPEVAAITSGRPPFLNPLIIDRFDGLLSEEFTIVPPVKMKSGQFAFATTRGFVMLRPQDFRADTRTPQVFIENVLANGHRVEPVDGILSLPPGVERIEIQYTGLNLLAPERLRFRSRLGGAERNWGPPGTARTAEYRNLGPGEYRFEVSASNGNGLWTPTPATLTIRLAPHFWQRAWFVASVAGAALVAVALTVRWRERRRAQRRIEVLERGQAVDAERARIARDLHDDVGASLTQVALLSELVQSNLTARPDRASQHVNEIFATAKQVTRALDEIVWAVNPTHDTIESFALFLATFVQNYSHTAGLRSRLDVPEILPASPLASHVRHHLYLGTKEVLHNIAKHAKATEIRLHLALEQNRFRLTIEDDGQGFDLTSTTASTEADGLRNLQRRLEQIGGHCTYRSQPGHGTTVEMLVPLSS